MIFAPNLRFEWLVHGFGQRDSTYPQDLTTVQQVHSARVLDACGRKAEQIGEGDAIISAESGVVAGMRTADCVPVLLADKVTHSVACVHAGWRGTAENIVGETIAAMTLRHGSRPEDLVAAIGPSIGPCCYTVGPDVAQNFGRWLPELAEVKKHVTLDLPAVNQLQLQAAGVRGIWKSGLCTYCNPDQFFSFRREKEKAGRMLSFIGRMT